jgi:hypothetical protein
LDRGDGFAGGCHAHGQDQFMFAFAQSKFSCSARKFLGEAEKFLALFDWACLRTSLLYRKFDLNSSLQVETRTSCFGAAPDPGLHVRDRVKQVFERVKLRRDHVTVRHDHVKLPAKLPCSSTIKL